MLQTPARAESDITKETIPRFAIDVAMHYLRVDHKSVVCRKIMHVDGMCRRIDCWVRKVSTHPPYCTASATAGVFIEQACDAKVAPYCI